MLLTSILATTSSLLKLAPQFDQYRLLRRKGSIFNLSFDHQLICIFSYGCSLTSAVFYLLSDSLYEQYVRKYPTYKQEELPVVKGVLAVEMVGFLISMLIITRILFIYYDHKDIMSHLGTKTDESSTTLDSPTEEMAALPYAPDESFSALILTILFILVSIGLYISYLCYDNKASLFWLDLVDYVWLCGTILDPFRLLPQLFMHWYMDSILPGLPPNYSKYQTASVICLLLSKVSIKDATTRWQEVPYNMGTYYYIIIYTLMLVILQVQFLLYRNMTRQVSPV